MLSIITATYNRGYIINNLFESLLRQTSKDFEWIIVDDGSTDNTSEIAQQWTNRRLDFPVYFYRQRNGGKHTAVNLGVEKACGDYCFIVDSDDILSDDAVESILGWWSQCAGIQHIAAVSGLKGGLQTHSRIGGFPALPQGKDYIEAKNTERRKLHLLGDKAESYRTSLLKSNPFMVYEGERFMSENTVWDELAYQGYAVRWYNKVIYYCEYLSDGLTWSGDTKEINNFKGFTYYTKQRIKCYGLIEGVIARGYYLNVAQKKGLTIKQASNNIGISSASLYLSYLLWLVKNLIVRIK